MAGPATPVPSLASARALSALDPKALKALGDRAAKIRGTAEDFESVFINSMFQQMFSNVGKGPFSGGQGAQIWSSFLTDEYSKSFVKSGGLGIANEVQRALMAQQEIR